LAKFFNKKEDICVINIFFFYFIYNYFIYALGSTFSLSFSISKCKCGSSAISKAAEFPTVPIVCPFCTSSPSDTNSAVNKLEYTDLYPFVCSIITVRPYLGSFFIATTVPFSDALTIVVLSAFISIPKCVTHSSNVFEYIKLSFAYPFVISPSTGKLNSGSFITS
jgi:hypothetical protein